MLVLQANCSDYLHAYVVDSVPRKPRFAAILDSATEVYEAPYTTPYHELELLLKERVVPRADIVTFVPLNWEFNSFWRRGVHWSLVPDYPPLYLSKRVLPYAERYLDELVEAAERTAEDDAIVEFYEAYRRLYRWARKSRVDAAGLFTEFKDDETWPRRGEPRRAALVVVRGGAVERRDFEFNSMRGLRTQLESLLAGLRTP